MSPDPDLPISLTSACHAQLFRVDVGLSAYYGGTLEVLEIEGDSVGVVYR